MSFLTFFIWSAFLYIVIAAIFPIVCQFYWYLSFGTRYDAVPWIFSYMTTGNYVVLPDVDISNDDTSLNQLSPVQQQLVTKYMFIAMIFTYIWSAWPILVSSSEESALNKTAGVINNIQKTQSQGREVISEMIERIRKELSVVTNPVDNVVNVRL